MNWWDLWCNGLSAFEDTGTWYCLKEDLLQILDWINCSEKNHDYMAFKIFGTCVKNVCKLKNVCYWFSKQPIKFQLWKKKVAKGEKQFLKLKMLAKTKGWRNSSSCSSNKSWVLTICCNVLLAISPALYALTNSHNNPLK